MNEFNELKGLVIALEEDATKFYEKNNKAAGVRLRKGLQDIKSMSQALRVDVSEKNKKAE